MTDSEKLDLLLERFEVMQGNMDKMQGNMDKMQGNMDTMQGSINTMQGNMDTMQGSIDTMQGNMNKMQEKITDNTSAIKSLQRDVTNIRLTLENEIKINIMRVAEGHLDLSRKLDEALKIDNEKEMMAIRLTIQENELRMLKDKVNQIA